MQAKQKIIVALDLPNPHNALELARSLRGTGCRVKVGKELFTRAGPALVEQLVKGGLDVFLDLKYHDIPNTVARACKAAADLGVWMINVHALGGKAMLEAAYNAVEQSTHRPLLIGVTVLTSMQTTDLQNIGIHDDMETTVLRFANMAKTAGLDGVVCSPREITLLRDNLGADFTLVTPGIRPLYAAHDDQQRVMTPAEALRRGSDYLVIGRPITGASHPLQALDKIASEMATDMAKE